MWVYLEQFIRVSFFKIGLTFSLFCILSFSWGWIEEDSRIVCFGKKHISYCSKSWCCFHCGCSFSCNKTFFNFLLRKLFLYFLHNKNRPNVIAEVSIEMKLCFLECELAIYIWIRLLLMVKITFEEKEKVWTWG